MASREPQDGPRGSQEGPDRSPRRLKRAPRRPESAPRRLNRAPRAAQRLPRRPKKLPRLLRIAPTTPKTTPRGAPGRPKRAPRAAKRIHHHCIISVIICNTTLCGTPPRKSVGSASTNPWDLPLSPEAQIPRKLRRIHAPEATIPRNSYGLLIVSRPCTTFPCCFKAAPRHPNPALIYPILLERGPAAGGEALTDM